jgi:hypothetical protein
MIAVRAARIEGNRAAAFAGLLLFAMAGEVLVGDAVASGKTNLVTLLVVAAVCASSFAFWKQAVYGVLVLVFVEGYFRNLFNDPAVLLIKDLAILAIYVRVIGDRVHRRVSILPASPITLPLAVFAGIVLVQMANPHVTSFQQTLVGVRTWLYYVPLYYVAREMIASEADLRRFAWFILLCAVPIGALGLYQYVAGAQAYGNLGPGFANATFITGDGASIIFRPNATFAWSSNFALFLALATLLCLGLLLGSGGYRRWALSTLLVALIAANVIENQRTLIVLLPPLMLLTVALRRSTGTAATAALSVVLGLAVVALIASPGTFLRVDGLIRNQDGIFHVRTMTYTEHFRMALRSPIGFGTGATAIGTRYVTGDIPLFVEFSLAKVAGDLSVVGLAAYLWLFAVLLKTTLAAHRWASRVKLAGAASLAAATFAFQLSVVYAGYDPAVVAVPFWFLSGAVVRFASNETTPWAMRRGGASS